MRSFTFWSVTLAVLVLVVFNVQGWMVLHRTSRALERELGDRLEAVAQTVALELAGDYESARARRLLDGVMRGNGLFNLFVVDEEMVYRANARDPERVGGTDPALELDEPQIVSALGGVAARSRLYAASGALLKTVYVPLADSLGAIEAVLGAEADARFFSALAGFRTSLLLTNALALVAVLVLVVLSVATARRALSIEQAAARANTLALTGQLSAAVAHEIKNPLAIIMAAAEQLRTRPGLEGDRAVGFINDEVARINHVLTNYLSLGSSQPAAVEPVGLAALVKEVLAGVEHTAAKQGVVIEAALAESVSVTGNRLALRQVLLNLVLNAIQAQPQGGMVRASVAVEGTGRRRTAVVRIEDRGPGIAAADRKRVFEPFFTTREKGSGLGLFVVRRVVEQHRGRVGLAPRPGGGTVVEVRLPV